MSNSWITDAIEGCILGGAIGDAMGGPFEGRTGPVAYVEHEAWKVSDDTQLTLATCESIAEQGGQVSPEHIAANFLKWFRQRRISGIGASTLAAMRSLDVGAAWWQAGAKGEMAAGNGAAMRAAPLAFCVDPSSDDGRRKVRDVCSITHRNEEAYIGALAVVYAIQIAVQSDDEGLSHLHGALASRLPDSRIRDRLVLLEQRSGGLAIDEFGVCFGCGGYVVESVPFALYAAQHISSVAFDDLIKTINEAGGDTDTTASIAGQVCGAFLGARQLPAALVNLLPSDPPIRSIASQFDATIGAEGR